MFFTKLLIVWTVIHFYVFWRLSSIPFISKKIPRIGMLLIMFAAWGSFLAGHTLDRMGVGAWAYPLEWFGANWMGILLLLAMCFGNADILTGFGLWLKKYLPATRTAALIAACLLSVFAMIQGTRAPIITEYEVTLPGLPAEADGLTAAVIADTHLGSLIGSKWMKARVAQIDAFQPDIILAVGDIIEGHGAREWENIPALQKLNAPLGVWAVTGNHESYGNSGSGANFLKAAGMEVLNVKWKEVRPGLILAGVDDFPGYVERTNFPDVERALSGIPKDAGVIFLSPQAGWRSDRSQGRGGPYAFGPYPWRANLAVQLSYKNEVPFVRRPLSGKKHDRHCVPRHRNLGTQDAFMATGRNFKNHPAL